MESNVTNHIHVFFSIPESGFTNFDNGVTKTFGFLPRVNVTDQIEIETPVLQSAVASTWNLLFLLDEYTLALGRAEGRVFDQLTLGDDTWKPMANSQYVNHFSEVCNFDPLFVALGSGECLLDVWRK